MENQSNTTHSKVQALGQNQNNKYLDIYIDNTVLEEKFQDGNFSIAPKKTAQLQILAKSRNNIEFRLNNKKYDFTEQIEYLTKSLSGLHPIITTDIKNYEHKKRDTLKTFLKSLCQIDKLRGFNSSQILVHQKGTTNIYSLTFKNSDYIESFEDPIFFNNLFAKVRKSKNKAFDQKELLNKDIRLDGHFLAKELVFRDFNLVILLSRDDLFPIADIDRFIFNDYILISIPKIYNIISIESERQFTRERDLIIKHFPIASFNIENDKSISINQNVEDHQQDTSSLHHERILLMGELLNTLRHELSNPLFGIDLSHNLLKDQTDDFDVKDTLEHISNSVKRSQAIIQEFSNLYQEDDKLSLISLKNLISETITLTKSESRSHRVIFDMNNDIVIMSNGTLLSQVIFNLLINSCQALTNDHVENSMIKLSVKEYDEYINIDIIDNGNGIPKSNCKNIFTPFFTTKDTGTGLGLAICRNLMSKINGEIQLLDSEIGAHFQLRINKVNHENTSN